MCKEIVGYYFLCAAIKNLRYIKFNNFIFYSHTHGSQSTCLRVLVLLSVCVCVSLCMCGLNYSILLGVCQGRHYFSFYGLHNEPSGNRERKAKKICERRSGEQEIRQWGLGNENCAGNRENWLPEAGKSVQGKLLDPINVMVLSKITLKASYLNWNLLGILNGKVFQILQSHIWYDNIFKYFSFVVTWKEFFYDCDFEKLTFLC